MINSLKEYKKKLLREDEVPRVKEKVRKRHFRKDKEIERES